MWQINAFILHPHIKHPPHVSLPSQVIYEHSVLFVTWNIVGYKQQGHYPSLRLHSYPHLNAIKPNLNPIRSLDWAP